MNVFLAAACFVFSFSGGVFFFFFLVLLESARVQVGSASEYTEAEESKQSTAGRGGGLDRTGVWVQVSNAQDGGLALPQPSRHPAER